MRIVSIDPGIAGGLAVLQADELPGARVIEVESMPTMARKKDGSGETVNQAALAAWLDRHEPTLVVLELVTGQLGRGKLRNGKPIVMGNSGAFNFGRGFGKIEGVCSRYSTVYVNAASWKKRAAIPRDNSDYARTLVLQRFPYLAEQLKRKKDLGRAEAVLIGLDYLEQIGRNEVGKLPVTSDAGYTMELEL
jgi:hypothetical protein